MTPDRFQLVRSLFDQALEQSPELRGSFLDRQCAGDPSLLAEIQELLAAHQRHASPMDRPAIELAGLGGSEEFETD